MRMLLQVTFPNEPFNTLVRRGETGKIMQRILEDLKPEAVYFTEDGGERTALMAINLTTPSDEIRRALFPELQCQMPVQGGDEPGRPKERRT
jgi:hypothetical protein